MSAKLSLDEKDYILSFLDSPSRDIVYKILASHLKDIENNVIRYNLASGPDGLVIEKARAEGAALILTRFKEGLVKLAKSQNK